MSIRTLREVCEVLGISRRTIQGYEELGLLVPSGKNERGWLLYDEACQERIKLLRFYQNAGFQGKEIIVLLASGGGSKDLKSLDICYKNLEKTKIGKTSKFKIGEGCKNGLTK